MKYTKDKQKLETAVVEIIRNIEFQSFLAKELISSYLMSIVF